MNKRRPEDWKNYLLWGQRERAIWWLMHVRSFTRRAAEAHVANYEKNEAPRK